LVPAVVGLCLVAVAGAASLMEQAQPGGILDRTGPLQSVASDAWTTALAATDEFRQSASRDLSMVLDKMRDATGDIVGEMRGETEESDEAEDVSPVSSESRGARPSFDPDRESESDVAAVEPAVLGGEGSESDPVAIHKARGGWTAWGVGRGQSSPAGINGAVR